MNGAFYGEDKPPIFYAVLALAHLVGDDECTRELVEACDYMERVCPEALAIPMPGWIQ